MKKWILVAFIPGLVLALIYLGIPKKIRINQAIKVPANERAFARVFQNQNKWSQWWPEMDDSTFDRSKPTTFPYNSNNYRIADNRLTSVLIAVGRPGNEIPSELIFVPTQDDKIAVNWIAEMEATNNPIERVRLYLKAQSLAKDMKAILLELRDYYAAEKNIYGLDIKKEFVKDSLLVSSFFQTPDYPNTEQIYLLVDRLKNFVHKNGAKQTGAPMVNISAEDRNVYYTKVAIPVNGKLKDSGDIAHRWMLGRGDILVMEVVGGISSINNAFVEMENYVTDHRRTAPAIPFQSLITDRRKETDTSKWITRIYWPVM